MLQKEVKVLLLSLLLTSGVLGIGIWLFLGRILPITSVNTLENNQKKTIIINQKHQLKKGLVLGKKYLGLVKLLHLKQMGLKQ
ncbi:hypothetical protein [Sphaerospermopsis sp. FACHB-1194]|uniref:hypothetical protein n=1 Tax=Sphaerospermopsis sp. FACHB-1194 TaxID=2692862 RepID=UPI00168004D3|nr:hypothetical protein [Sphaerospermopsis sp. FACHB-1194]MBD2144952.1 hypothetical protein [Sphaerospermopsis sp. FACHB-1194]